MDINPLIADLNKYRDELALSISIAFDLHELEKSDVYIANDIAEIKGEGATIDPFQQVADLYNLPRKEVVQNIRKFTNKCYKDEFRIGSLEPKDIEFDQSEEQLACHLEYCTSNSSA
ncbi:MAG: hypothetical protein D3903_04250 [Candidatus Electrothrix sp. GM3_4]|nr:hypothetical protein [Candidatus Electrothrix sp. GM3_4]